jgi:hypothetical protein
MKISFLTKRVVQWLQDGRPAWILHLFNDVCNLVNDQGDVVSLVTPGIGAGPFFMVGEEGFTTALDPGLPVSVDPRRRSLQIGRLCFETSQAALWNPRPAWHALRSDAHFQRDQSSVQVGIEIEDPLQQLLAGITNGRLEDIRSGAHRLAGLGGGLTPAGDDVLMGVIYGLWVWKPDRDWIGLIVDTAVPRTTTLSASFLRAAGDGEATIHWHDLVLGRQHAVERILAIGETSGQDAWAGFVRLGLRLAESAM